MTTMQALTTALSARVPTVLWGAPGSGKTSAIRSMAEVSTLPLEVVIASIREPSDFAGLPVVTDEGSVRFAPPLWARRLAEAGHGLLFLDELSTAPPAVQAALLRVVLERTVGDLELPAGVTIVAAANPPDQAADGWELSGPLSNRFCHLDWSLDVKAWSNGMLGGFERAEVAELDPAVVETAAIAHRARIGGFLVAHATLLSAPPGDAVSAGRAWPSPRTWTMAATLLAAAELVGVDRTTTSMLVAGAVGPGAAREYLAWVEEASLPDPEEALADPESFVLPERGDRAYAALSAIVAAVRTDPTPERWASAWRAIAVGVDAGRADLAVAVMRPLIEIRPGGALPPRSALATVTPVLRDAGLLDRLMSPDGSSDR